MNIKSPLSTPPWNRVQVNCVLSHSCWFSLRQCIYLRLHIVNRLPYLSSKSSLAVWYPVWGGIKVQQSITWTTSGHLHRLMRLASHVCNGSLNVRRIRWSGNTGGISVEREQLSSWSLQYSCKLSLLIKQFYELCRGWVRPWAVLHCW